MTTALELMRAGYSDRYIARQVHMATKRVSQIRQRAGIPKVACGPKPSTAEDRFWRLAEPVDGGHLLWPHAATTMRLGHEGPKASIRRIAFRIGNGRDPIGQVRPGCGQPGCIHPQHVEDQPMRDTYRAIFGGVA
jgi:hypothetical protein